MNDLPRRPIEPLPPPPGQLDSVLARAHYRRHRKVTTVLTVSTVFLAGVAGGLSLGGVTGVQDTVARIATGVVSQVTASSPPTASAEASEQKPGRDRDRPTKGVRRSAPAAASPGPAVQETATQAAPREPLAVSGRAVDAAGEPVAGLFVYPGRKGVDGFVPTAQPVGRTAPDGTFSLACTRTPVLLSPWPVNAPAAGLARSAAWAATFVGGVTDAAAAPDATCTRPGKVVRTIVQPGSAVAGTVAMPTDCADSTHPLWLWLHNDRGLTVRVPDLVDGATFRIGGLPPGQHTLGANGNRTQVTVGGGETQLTPVVFACPPGTTEPSAEPTPSATPAETPSPSSPASPAPSPSTSGEPTGTARPTPTESPSGSSEALRR